VTISDTFLLEKNEDDAKPNLDVDSL